MPVPPTPDATPRHLPAPHRARQDPRRRRPRRRRRSPRRLLRPRDPPRRRRRRRSARPRPGRSGRGRASASHRRRRRPAFARRARRRRPPSTTTHPAYSCGYYSYFSGVPLPDGAEAYVADRAGVLAFPTNDGLTCIGAGAPHDFFHEYRADIEANFYRLVERAAPAFAARVRAGKREERWTGTADTRNFFRQALRPRLGALRRRRLPQGLRHRPRHRRRLPRRRAPLEALHAGLSGAQPLDDALAAYQRRRDEAAKPMYEITLKMAQFPSLEEMMATFAGPAPQT